MCNHTFHFKVFNMDKQDIFRCRNAAQQQCLLDLFFPWRGQLKADVKFFWDIHQHWDTVALTSCLCPCLSRAVGLYLGLLHCLSRYVTPLSQLREQLVHDDHSDHWPCWGLGPSSPFFTHWPRRHHWEIKILHIIKRKKREERQPGKERCTQTHKSVMAVRI